MMTLVYLGGIAFVVLVVAGIAQFNTNAADRRLIVSAALAGTYAEDSRRSRLERVNRRFTRGRLGAALERDLVLAGIGYPAVTVFAGVLVAAVLIPYALSLLLAPVFAVVGLAVVYFLLRTWLRQARERRREKFVQQIPELARVLSNATNAGLSIATAWAVAEGEMADPARTEIQRLNSAIRFGASPEEAMLQINERLPAREVRVLMSTLVVSSRSGGSLVKALRDISLTLDARKEVRREVRTTLAQSRTTALLVSIMVAGMLVMLNIVQPGTVQKMTTNIFGQVALVVSFVLVLVAHLIIRRITRIEL